MIETMYIRFALENLFPSPSSKSQHKATFPFDDEVRAAYSAVSAAMVQPSELWTQFERKIMLWAIIQRFHIQ